jgi:outer membrane protein assembly factor BamB
MIDLDLVPVPDERPQRPPAGPGLKAACLAVVVLLSLTAAQAPRTGISRLLTVGTTPASAHVLSADALFVTDFSDGQADDSTVRRFALDGGTVQWSTRLPESARGLALQAGARVLLTMNSDESTTAVDADTGQVLWRSPGGVTELTPDAALIVRYAADRRTALLRLVSLRSGNLVWARPVEVDATWRTLGGPPPAAGPRRLVIIAGNGAATTVRFDTGKTVAQAELNIRLRQWEGNYREDYRDDFAEISAVGDGLYVVSGHDGVVTLTAYDGETLAVRWRSTGVPPGRVDPCGSVLCVTDLSVFGSDPSVVAPDREIVAIDPRTGAKRWSSRSWQSTYALTDDRLIATTGVGNGTQSPWTLLDASSGRVITDLGVGNPLGNGAEGVRGTLRFVHMDTARPELAWVSTIDLRTGRSSIEGSVDQVTPVCDVAGRHLACTIIGGPLAVWRLPG